MPVNISRSTKSLVGFPAFRKKVRHRNSHIVPSRQDMSADKQAVSGEIPAFAFDNGLDNGGESEADRREEYRQRDRRAEARKDQSKSSRSAKEFAMQYVVAKLTNPSSISSEVHSHSTPKLYRIFRIFKPFSKPNECVASTRCRGSKRALEDIEPVTNPHVMPLRPISKIPW